jgi:hypothetical protein
MIYWLRVYRPTIYRLIASLPAIHLFNLLPIYWVMIYRPTRVCQNITMENEKSTGRLESLFHLPPLVYWLSIRPLSDPI